MRHSGPGRVHSKHHTYRKLMSSNMENHICCAICMQIHSPRSWDWLVADWHQKLLASELLKYIGRTKSMSNVVRCHFFRVTHPISRPYYMVRRRCTKIPSWEQDVYQLDHMMVDMGLDKIVYHDRELRHDRIFIAWIKNWESDIMITIY